AGVPRLQRAQCRPRFSPTRGACFGAERPPWGGSVPATSVSGSARFGRQEKGCRGQNSGVRAACAARSFGVGTQDTLRVAQRGAKWPTCFRTGPYPTSVI